MCVDFGYGGFYVCVCLCVCLNHRFTTGTDTGAVKERPRWRAFQQKTQGHTDDEIHNNEINSNRQEKKILNYTTSKHMEKAEQKEE